MEELSGHQEWLNERIELHIRAVVWSSDCLSWNFSYAYDVQNELKWRELAEIEKVIQSVEVYDDATDQVKAQRVYDKLVEVIRMFLLQYLTNDTF